MPSAKGVLDGIVSDVLVEIVVATLISLFPWLGATWASAILAWIVTRVIAPLMKKLQEQYNIIFIDWEVIEQNNDYLIEVGKMRDIVGRIERGELDENDQEVIDARESYKDKLKDLIRITPG